MSCMMMGGKHCFLMVKQQKQSCALPPTLDLAAQIQNQASECGNVKKCFLLARFKMFIQEMKNWECKFEKKADSKGPSNWRRLQNPDSCWQRDLPLNWLLKPCFPLTLAPSFLFFTLVFVKASTEVVFLPSKDFAKHTHA